MKIDVNKPLENPKLKELFAQRRQSQSAVQTKRIMESLMEEITTNAYFLSLVEFSKQPEKTEQGQVKLAQGTTLSFPMLTTQDGRQFYPVFIDWEEFGKWEAMKYRKPQTMIMNFDDYAAMIIDKGRGSGIVINPFSDNLLLDRGMMTHLRRQKQLGTEGHAEYRVPSETTVKLGDPAYYPDDLVNALCTYAKKEKSVHTLWIRLMEKSGEQSYLLIVDFIGEKKTIFDAIGKAARPYLNQMYLDIVPFTSDLGQKAANGVRPIYQKKRGLFH